MMPIACSIVLHVDEGTSVYVMSGRTTCEKVVTRMMDAAKTKEPTVKTAVSCSFWLVRRLRRQIIGRVSVKIIKSMQAPATPFHR